MEDPKKKSTFVFQAGILAAAGMLVKVIGLIYRSPLLSIIGIEGSGYYNAAINIYTIILLISSYSIPSAISKVIAQRLAFKEYRNAQRVFVCALLYVLVVGGAASILTFVGAPFLVEKNPNAVLALRVLSPTIFFSGFLGVLRGFFQAHGSMVHTSISQILEQIINAAVSILAAKLLIGLVMEGDTTRRAIYGSAGSALGTGAGVVIGLLFMLGMYRLNGGMIRRRVERDKTWHEESYKEIFKVIFTIVTPFILSTFIYNCTTVVNMYIYLYVMDYKKMDPILSSNHYGIFSGLAVAVVNIPIAIASSMSSAIMPGVAASYAKGTVAQTRKQITRAIQMTMLIAIPAAVGIAVLPRPIMQFIFPQKESLDIAMQEEDLVQIREELIESGYIRRKGGSKKVKITSKPFHYVSSDGFHIYVGKNNFQNDELTFKFANGNDWWFHAKQIPGSHVVLKTEGAEVPDRTFEEAARLAAYYSKGREQDKVEIDYVQKKHVKKPAGAKPGFVVYYTNYSMAIDSDISDLSEFS